MHLVVESRRAELTALCRRHGVRRLELFGSAARDDFDEDKSDLDFLVELAGDAQSSPLDEYFDLKDALEALFSRSVDLVSRKSVRNPYISASIDKDRVVVYAA
jgi:predicted nucleotidyltransferase